MGYTTDFAGSWTITPPLQTVHCEYLRKFADTRRMQRDPEIAKTLPDPVREAVNLPIGEEGGYFVGGGGFCGQDKDASVLDYNSAPVEQMGLWCKWEPSEDGTKLKWSEAEKFYDYVEWLKYLIEHFFRSWGYHLNGVVNWQGEDDSDIGYIDVTDNTVTEVKGRHSTAAQTPGCMWEDEDEDEDEEDEDDEDEENEPKEAHELGSDDPTVPGAPNPNPLFEMRLNVTVETTVIAHLPRLEALALVKLPPRYEHALPIDLKLRDLPDWDRALKEATMLTLVAAHPKDPDALGVPKKAATKKAVTKKAVTKKAVTKKAATKKAVTKKAATKKPAKKPRAKKLAAIQPAKVPRKKAAKNAIKKATGLALLEKLAKKKSGRDWSAWPSRTRSR